MKLNFVFRKMKKSAAKLVIPTLVASSLTLVQMPQSASAAVGSTNVSAVTLLPNTYLFVGTANSTSAATLGNTSATDTVSTAAVSYNLRFKDETTPATAVAQTATVLVSGALSLYTAISTSTAISATGGTISASAAANTITISSNTAATGVAFTVPSGISAAAGTAVAAIWTAPSTAGVYTISLSTRGSVTDISADAPLNGWEPSTIRVNVVSDSHPAVGGTNVTETLGALNSSLFVGVASNTSNATGTLYTVSGTTPGNGNESTALSKGLLYKDSTYRTAQTATILAGGQLSLYATVSTTSAFTASNGSFGSSSVRATSSPTVTYSENLRTALIPGTDATASTVAALWTAPTTAGVYTVSLYTSDGVTNPTLSSPAVNLAGSITVTVQTSAASNAPVVAYSTCVTDTDGTLSSTSDSTSIVQTGNSWYINFLLRNAYVSPVSTNGNLVVTSSSADAVVSIGSGTHAVGTGTTSVQYGTGASGSTYDSIRVAQATSGKPVTTTITLTYDGAVVCTKTVSIRGEAASMAFSNISSVKTGGAAAVAGWMADGSGRSGHYKVTLKDAAGNTVLPASGSEFSSDAASLTTTVTALAVAEESEASGLASASVAKGWDTSVGTFTCGPNAGSSKVKLKHTTTATGKIITGEFTARCAGDAYTYTASFDKASYNQGDIATLTVKFVDSKGNPANSQTQVGAASMILPMMTFVTATGAATTLTKEDGSVVYTLTVGTETGMTAGTYTGIIDFSGLTAVAATKQNVTYKVGTGSQDVTFTEVLKSVVALIASINKQIQALQKLILKR